MSKVVLLADGAAQTKNRMLLCLPVSFWAGLGYVYYSKGNYFWLCACLLFFAAAPYQYKYVIRWCIVHLRLCHRFERYAYRRIGINSWSREKKVCYPILLSPESHTHFCRIWYAPMIIYLHHAQLPCYTYSINPSKSTQVCYPCFQVMLPLLKWDIRDAIVDGGGKWNSGTYSHHSLFLNHTCSAQNVLWMKPVNLKRS